MNYKIGLDLSLEEIDLLLKALSLQKRDLIDKKLGLPSLEYEYIQYEKLSFMLVEKKDILISLRGI